MKRLAINSADAFILVYSVDEPKSFEELEQLRQTILMEREQAYLEASASLNTPNNINITTVRHTSNGDCSSVASSTGSMLANTSQSQTCPPSTINVDQQAAQKPEVSPSRHWSLSSLFSSQQQQTTLSSSSLGSSLSSSNHSVCSSAESSRRSSISAAEAALKTRRTRYPPMVIVANKHDLPMEQHLVNSDAKDAQVVIDWCNGFVRASAALNWNIDEIFQQVLKQAKQPPTLSEAIVSKRRKSLPPKLPSTGNNVVNHHLRAS